MPEVAPGDPAARGERTSGGRPVGGARVAAPDPALELLLDPHRLSGLVGRPVRATRLRPKPGVSHTAALLDAQASAPVGWVQALLGEARVKADKAAARAARVGLDAQVHRAEVPELDLTLTWGPIETDPRLYRPMAGIDLSTATLLRYNPLRRAVLRVGGYVVRLTADPHRERLAGLARRLLDLGVPVPEPVSPRQAGITGGPGTSVWRWVEGHDLAQASTPTQTSAAGRLLAQLHSVPLQQVEGLTSRGWTDQVSAARASVEQLADVAPQEAGEARSALARLDALDRPPPAPGLDGADVLLHGDFSLDQCFATGAAREEVAPAAATGRTGLVLGDLDRASLGPAEIDLAGAVAAGLVSGANPELLLDGYAAARGLDGPGAQRRSQLREALSPWGAAALLARVTEPWRAQDPGWQEEVRRIGRLASGLLGPGGGGAWRVPGTICADADLVEVRRAWPDKVVDGVARVSVEGPDRQGRLRAGTVDRAGRVILHPPGQDRRLPALREVAPLGRLVVHRSGRRAVVALPDRYVKVVRPGRAPAVARAAEQGRAIAVAAGLDAPAVLQFDAGQVALAVVPGRPVHDLSEDPAWDQIWSTWAQAWALLQAQRTDELAPHTCQDEAEVLRAWARRAEVAGVLHGTGWLDRLARTADELAALDVRRQVPTHRDLHDKQLLWHDGRLALLDFDTACRAEPEVDLANLAVHARLRGAQGRWSGAASRTVLAAVAHVAGAAAADAARMSLAERATLARLAAVYAFRPTWRDQVLSWAEGEWCSGSRLADLRR